MFLQLVSFHKIAHIIPELLGNHYFGMVQVFFKRIIDHCAFFSIISLFFDNPYMDFHFGLLKFSYNFSMKQE